jgi:hypothetical protein
MTPNTLLLKRRGAVVAKVADIMCIVYYVHTMHVLCLLQHIIVIMVLYIISSNAAMLLFWVWLLAAGGGLLVV